MATNKIKIRRARAEWWMTAAVLGTLAAASGWQCLPAAEAVSRGGRLVVSQRSEPKTLNPVTALDGSSRGIIGLLHADLIHINRHSLNTEPGVASSWKVSSDGRVYTLELRHGLKFSDGQPFDSDDVLFTFEAYLDEHVHASQRDLLLIAGKPINVQKVDAYTVRFELAQPYAAAERLFDSIAILPRHLLKRVYDAGGLAQAWNLAVPPAQVAGLGPFRVKQYVAGQRIILERNPYYWKKDSAGNSLPYLDEIDLEFTGNAEAEVMRFQRGEIDVAGRLSAANFSALEKHQREGRFRLFDLGPGLEYNFLFFNLNNLDASHTSIVQRQPWFRQLAFRKAISEAIDREAICRLTYQGRARPLSTHVTAGNKLWVNGNIPLAVHSAVKAREYLRNAGYSWTGAGHLIDGRRNPVSFSLIFNAGNPQHTQIATLIENDLEQIGMDVKVVPLEYRALLDRIFKSYDYDASILQLASGDADPNSEINVWTSDGGTHVWNLGPKKERAPWQEEVDRLMQQQMITTGYARRKQMYDRVQQLIWENLPVICLVSPDVLAGASERVGNFRPAILSDYALWNAEELFVRH